MTEKRGRPSIYVPLLKGIAALAVPGEWHSVRQGHQTRTVVSQLRSRYPGFDFRAVPAGDGTWNIEAAWRGNVTQY